MGIFQKQDRRSYTLITPCKRSAARGLWTQLRPHNPMLGVAFGYAEQGPRAALRLHGVINVIRLPA